MDATTTEGTDASTARAPEDTLDRAHQVMERLGGRLRAAIRGRDDVIELVLIALVADGHVLLEDYPGSGKTTLAKALGESIVDADDAEGSDGAPQPLPEAPESFNPFRRIQFTPDLLPSDVTGTSVFDVDSGTFVFRPGPLFAHVVLADEINRTSPKVQAALLEAMAEKQVTVDNVTHPLDELFFVIATQNPLDLSGTYPLPTPQLDRFLFKVTMEHIDRQSELEVLDQYPRSSLEHGEGLAPVTRKDVLRARRAIRGAVHVAQPLREGLVDTARSLRADPRVLQGTSTRSLVLALPALQARAVARQRDSVIPEDLEALAPFVFAHRIECAPGVDDPAEVVREHVSPQLEALAKHSMRRAT